MVVGLNHFTLQNGREQEEYLSAAVLCQSAGGFFVIIIGPVSVCSLLFVRMNFFARLF